MDLLTTCNTCGKSVKDRNSSKCNLCQKKVHLKLTTIMVKIYFHLQQ